MTLRGIVSERLAAIVPLQLFGPAGALDVSAVVDSGFTASLTLPASVIISLGLVRTSHSSAFLADGSEQEFDVFEVEVKCGDDRSKALAFGIGREILLGMGFLAGHELRVEVVPGGAVEVRRLP